MNTSRQQPDRSDDAESPVNAKSEFDAYHKWLGIPPREQPPNRYRLLGLDLFETDADVIDAAAMKQITYVRQCATGPHADVSQLLLNELSDAQLCLLNPEQKAAYDAKLKAELQAVEQSSASSESGSTGKKKVDPKSGQLTRKLDKQKKQIESLLEKCEFAAAVSELEKLAAVAHPEAAKYVKWAQQQIPKAKRGTQEMRESSKAMYRTAADLVDRNDYEEAAEILQQIPQKYRDEKARELLQECLDLQEEIAAIQEDIDHAESLKKYDDLQPTVERLLEIKPTDRRARQLLKELKTYGKGGGMRLGGREDGRFDAAGNTSSPLKVALFIGIPLVLFGIVGWATVAYVRSNDKTIKFEIDDPTVQVKIDDKSIETTGGSGTVSLKVGMHNIVVERGDSIVHTRQFEVVKGKNPVLQISVKDNDQQVSTNDGPTRPTPQRPPSPTAAPFEAAAASRFQQDWAMHVGVPVETTNSIGMKLRLVPPGEFTMGSPQSEIDELLQSTKSAGWRQRFLGEKQHVETVSNPFYFGVHEVTQGQFEAVMGVNPAEHSANGRRKDKVAGIDTSRFPVEMISWYDAVDFCNKLSEQEGLQPRYQRNGEETKFVNGNGYRLPTEVEWEYACRAGTETRWSFGNDEEELPKYAWCRVNSGGLTHAVGELLPNPFGLYDMHGNVWEWCQEEIPPDKESTEDKRHRTRGGSYSFSPQYARSACLSSIVSDLHFALSGFRVARDVMVSE